MFFKNRTAVSVRDTFYILAFSLAGAVLSGCNSGIDLGSVSGHITSGGKPRPDALVVFTPVDGRRWSQGRSDGSGRYELYYTIDKMGAVPGHHRVTISDANNPATVLMTKEVDVSSGSQSLDFDLAEASAPAKK